MVSTMTSAPLRASTSPVNSFVPSQQQLAFLEWVETGTGSCVLEAGAGAGKTTTLLEAIDRTGGGVALLAYNKKIADEIKGRLQARGVDWRVAEAGTVHSFGFRAYRKVYPGVKVSDTKVLDILVASMKSNPFHPLWSYRHEIATLVSLAKQRALGIIGEIDDERQWRDIITHFDLFSSISDDEDSQKSIQKSSQESDAAKVVIEARAAGIRLSLDGNDLVLEASAPPSPAVLELLSRHKPAIVDWLRPGPDGWSRDDWHSYQESGQESSQESGQESSKKSPTLISLIITQGQRALQASNALSEIIDFDDMIYLPLIRGLKFWKYRWVFIDEAQDTNPARRALVRAMLAPGGRVVAVGDRHQAVYGFTGADSDSLDLIAQDFSAIYLPLTTTYRCPRRIVEFAQRWVSHIECAETAPEGSVSVIPYDALFHFGNLDGTSAILCRNTKPLVKLAFTFIRRGIACAVEGRDIGKGLIALATKWKRVKTLSALEDALEVYQDHQVQKALAKKLETKAQSIEDQCETLRVIISSCRESGTGSIDAVVKTIKDLFSDKITGILTLCTIHKSKGREWPTVFWLDRHGTLPSRYARQEWQRIQENNLCYVAATRAMSTLIEVSPDPIEPDIHQVRYEES